MKRIAFALCALLLAPIAALATPVMPKAPVFPSMKDMMHQMMPTVISVHGSGTVSQMPDVADITVNINTTDTQATRVTSRNNAIYERIAG
ncbi:MAG TPA: SIMPL domain-containing protein, partial [Candidatus Dormibacteraeota bacterium]|nr:SIMPL domain-containing protein [Candidatus Dormibacteraeota bacterium]